MTLPPAPGSRARLSWLVVIAVVLMSFNLRPGATSIGPVLSEVLQGLGQDATWGAVLTALPGMSFAVFGALAVALSVRAGLTWALAIGMTAAAAGLLLRSAATDPTMFLVCTVIAFAGMAIGNVLVPPFVKRFFPTRVHQMMTVYTAVLSAGATLPTALAVPLSHSLPGGWRASLGTWGLTAVAAVAPLLLLARRDPGRIAGTTHAGRRVPMVRSRKAVALGVFFGTQSMQAYVQFGWVAQMYRDGGLDQTTAALMGTIIAGMGIVTGVLMPTVVHRLRSLRAVVVAVGVLLVAGYLGVWLVPTLLPWLWALLLGLSGAAFPTALALITARTSEPQVTARLSGFSQSVGYALAAVGPFAVGALYEMTGGWTVPFSLLLASSVVFVASGLVAASPGTVDAELGAAQ